MSESRQTLVYVARVLVLWRELKEVLVGEPLMTWGGDWGVLYAPHCGLQAISIKWHTFVLRVWATLSLNHEIGLENNLCCLTLIRGSEPKTTSQAHHCEEEQKLLFSMV